MMMRSPILFGLLIGLSSALTVASNLPIRAAEPTLNQRIRTPPQKPQPTTLTLERTACFGICPMYKVTIYETGKVVYEGKRFVKVTGIKTTTISPTAVRKLVSEFQKIQYFKLQDSYTGGHTDAPSAITSLTMGKKQKTVNHYLPSPNAPAELTQLENDIDAAVNSRQWIGTNITRSLDGAVR